MRIGGDSESLAISVHGPAGVLDVVVPGGAAVWDVAREYAETAGLAAIPLIYTRAGRPLAPDAVLLERGFASGDLLVASGSAYRAPRRGLGVRLAVRETDPPGGGSAALFAAVGLAAVVSGVIVSRHDEVTWRSAPVLLLLLAGVAGILPRGRVAAHRALVAPAFVGAAAYALAWRPGAEHLPGVIAVSALAAALSAAGARVVGARAREGLLVWIVAGLGIGGLCGAVALLSWPPALAWSLLVLAAMLAARFVPEVAVGVPDRLLLDLDRLAVTAWSAREPEPVRRGRLVVPMSYVGDLAHRGARTVTAGAAAVAVVAVAGSGMLLEAVERPLDLAGARALVLLVAATLLLVARSHRHRGARDLLRAGGLGCAGWAAVSVMTGMSSARLLVIFGVTVAAAVALVIAAVALGRGWRSVWWARLAELAETACGAAAVAAVFLASGGFRTLMDLAARHTPS